MRKVSEKRRIFYLEYFLFGKEVAYQKMGSISWEKSQLILMCHSLVRALR